MTEKKEKSGIKIILLGDSAVGKSKLVERFLMDGYRPQQLSTYALTLFNYTTTIDNETVKVDFWDTAGQERFQSVHPSYYHQAHCCILVFDVERKITYKNLEKWYKELQSYRKGIPCIVVANKIDSMSEHWNESHSIIEDLSVTSKQFAFATKRQLPLFYCSAAEGTNVVKMFQNAIRLGKKCRDDPPEDFVSDVLNLLQED